MTNQGSWPRPGLHRRTPDRLEQAIRQLIAGNEAIPDRQNEYGAFYRVEGVLVGPEGVLLAVTIWIQQTFEDRYRFVTLKPAR